MNIKDTIYLVLPATMYGRVIPQSAQILKATIVEILEGKITVEIDLGEGKSMYKEINKNDYYSTFAKALNGLEPFVNKGTKFIEEKDYKGEDLVVNFNETE